MRNALQEKWMKLDGCICIRTVVVQSAQNPKVMLEFTSASTENVGSYRASVLTDAGRPCTLDRRRALCDYGVWFIVRAFHRLMLTVMWTFRLRLPTWTNRKLSRLPKTSTGARFRSRIIPIQVIFLRTPRWKRCLFKNFHEITPFRKYFHY